MALMPLGTARERFIREGRAAAMLAHPHIVPMYDVITELPVPALVMQYIAGPTLERWVAEHGAMPWQDAVRIGSQLADALDAAHAQGLVHRDIKPSNVLLEADGTRALLTDFGLVRAMDDAALTHSGMLAGTPHFMSPEQARSEDVDGRSDLFSLGSLLYFAMSGQPPFRGREPMAVLNRLCHAAQSPLCEVDREIPLEVSRLVDRLLSKQPGKRPATSREVSEELRSLLRAPRRLRRQQPQTRLSSRTVRLCLCLACLGLLAAGLTWSSKTHAPETLFPTPVKTFPTASDRTVAADPSRPSSEASEHELTRDQSVVPGFDSAADRSAFADLEQLAREAAELDIAIEVLNESVPTLPASGLSGREAFAPMSQAAVSLEAELERLRQRQSETLAAPVNP
jgi:serine/threonine-protein kinase